MTSFRKGEYVCQKKIHIHDWVNFKYTVTKNVEICV